MLTQEFFVKYPLYRKFKVQLPERVQNLSMPAIHIYCENCHTENTFAGSVSLTNVKQKKQPSEASFLVAGKAGIVQYRCASCNDYYQFYFLYLDEEREYVMKVGQYPSWTISIDRNLSEVLAEYDGTFRKGLICESQGYGIGAFAYYRRIVEGIIDQLLNLIGDLFTDDDRTLYEQALAQAQTGIVAKEKIALVKDLLPKQLRPNDMNPLSVLHEALSIGLHSETDEECLEFAADIRGVLTYLVEQINLAKQTKESALRFTDGMKKLLDKKATKGLKTDSETASLQEEL